MADSIIRLKVESQEYDSKLKRASEGLTRYADECRKVGGTLEVVEKDTLDYVRSLGRMDTASRTATGKLAEMKKAFVELSAQYKQMTDAEKASPFGKALAQSLSQLKTRIGESRSQLDGIKQEMSGGLSGALEAVAGKFGLNVSQLTKFGVALAAVKGAMELAKGVIESTEATHDAFAKAVEVSDNMTNQFLRSLATADFSNFINGMQGIIDKTIAAYEAMDEFESYAARFQPWQQAKESEIQTKLMQARAAKAQGDTKRAEQLTNEAKTLIDQLATSTKAYGEKQTKGGFSTIRSLMGPVDISDRQIAWYADPKNWDEAIRKAEKFDRLQEKIQRGNAMSGNAAQHEEARRAQQELDRDPSLRRAYTMMNLRDSGDSKQAQQFRRALGDIYGNTLAESRIESLRARADRMDGVISGAGGRGGSKTFKAESISSKYRPGVGFGATESMNDLRARQQYWQKMLASAANSLDYSTAEANLQDVISRMNLQPVALSLGISTEQADVIQSRITEMVDSVAENIEPLPIKLGIDPETGIDLDKAMAKRLKGISSDATDVSANVSKAASAVGQLGSALAAMEDPGVKVAGMIANAIASVAMTFASSLKGTVTPWDWIAAAVAGTATMISTIAAIHSATGYAEGGVIPGNSLSGDNQLARVNAGEVILNRAQASNIANALENPSQAAPANRPSFVRGQDIYLGLNNYLRASGRGQLITSRH